MAELKARQVPTQSVVLPYEHSKGKEAIELYNKTTRTAQEWQELMIYDIMALNSDDLWTHSKFGYSLPRRNGKNEIVAIRELWGLFNGERMRHTAHQTRTSRGAWERLRMMLDDLGLQEPKDYKVTSTIGMESIRLKSTNGRVDFGTRSSKSGLGEGFDLLIIDEAQEYTDDQESALKYVVTDSRNPQTILCGTPPTPISSGTVFTKLRKACLLGETIDTGWAEWSVPDQTDVKDKAKWYETNPSLGTILTERAVMSEVGEDDVDFNIQRLGLWLRYNQKSAISKAEWENLQVEQMPGLTSPLFVGIKYGHDGTNVSMSISAKTDDGKVFLEAIDCRPVRAGTDWIIDFLKGTDVAEAVVDGANGQDILATEMKKAKLKAPILPTVKEVIVANAGFEQALFSESICHMGQPALVQSVSNCEKRQIGSNGGFGYRSLNEKIEVSLLESCILAHWLCCEHKEKTKQKISY